MFSSLKGNFTLIDNNLTSWRYKMFGIKDASFFDYTQIFRVQNHL